MNRKLTLTALLALTAICASAQIAPDTDWAQFGRYAADNEKVTEKPLAVLMGDSITDNWDREDPDFFPENNIVCRGISGQTSSQMLIRFRQDVIELHPKYVVILAGTNDLACNTGCISPENYHSALAAEDGSFPRKYSYDGVHPGLAGYKIMEPLLLSILK